MGTEKVVISYLTTPLILIVSLLLLFKTKFPNGKAIVLCVLNLIFMSYFVISGAIGGYLLQAFLVGGFLLIPFQLASILLSYILGGLVSKWMRNGKHVT